jgi:hypothetical protein
MKYITIKHKKTISSDTANATTLLSMSNVQTVEFITQGTGAKSNPFKYSLTVVYTNGEKQEFKFKTDGDTALEVRKQIFTALKNDNDVIIIDC